MITPMIKSLTIPGATWAVDPKSKPQAYAYTLEYGVTPNINCKTVFGFTVLSPASPDSFDLLNIDYVYNGKSPTETDRTVLKAIQL